MATLKKMRREANKVSHRYIKAWRKRTRRHKRMTPVAAFRDLRGVA